MEEAREEQNTGGPGSTFRVLPFPLSTLHGSSTPLKKIEEEKKKVQYELPLIVNQRRSGLANLAQSSTCLCAPQTLLPSSQDFLFSSFFSSRTYGVVTGIYSHTCRLHLRGGWAFFDLAVTEQLHHTQQIQWFLFFSISKFSTAGSGWM